MSDGTPEIRTGVYTVTVGKRESDGMPVCRVRRFEKPLSDEEAMALFGALWRTLAFDGGADPTQEGPASVDEPTRLGPGPGDPGTSRPTHMGRG